MDRCLDGIGWKMGGEQHLHLFLLFSVSGTWARESWCIVLFASFHGWRFSNTRHLIFETKLGGFRLNVVSSVEGTVQILKYNTQNKL